MNKKFNVLSILFLFMLSSPTLVCCQSKQERPLWPEGIPNNPVKYETEKIRTEEVLESSLSQKSRILRQVSEPTYTLYRPEKSISNGVAIVICPGGGFEELWIDREGTDFALWLTKQGITALVLKYRTFNTNAKGFNLKRSVFNGEVYADAKQAIHTLRSRAKELNLEKSKIGIGGFSSGGALSFFTALEIYENSLPDYANFKESSNPNFVCFVYGSVHDGFIEAINEKEKEKIPPMFLVNGAEDNGTPADKCIKLYTALFNKNVPAELHIYSKAKHGFDSGIGRGHSVATWRDSFINWLKDLKFMD